MGWIHRGLHPPPAGEMQPSITDDVSHHRAELPRAVTKHCVMTGGDAGRVGQQAERCPASRDRPVSRRADHAPWQAMIPLGSHLPWAMVTKPPATASSF